MQTPEDIELHAWVDESMRNVGVPVPMYLLGAVVADPSQCDGAREDLKKIKPKSAPKLHWHAMEPREKNRATKLVTSFKAEHLVVVGTPLNHRKQERARAQCMKQLYWTLGEWGVSNVFLEAREKSQREKDLKLVSDLRSQHALPKTLRVEIGFPKDEPMLWIPDQVLGALGDAAANNAKWLNQYEGAIHRIDIAL